MKAWNAIDDMTSAAVFEAFIREFPDTVYATFATARLEELKPATAAGAEVPCDPQLVQKYERAPEPKALVGNEIGCTQWGGGFSTVDEVVKAALAKCNADSGKECRLIRFAGRPAL